MNPLFYAFFLLLLVGGCASPESAVLFSVQNVLLPLEPPLTARPIQSRTIRPIELPEGAVKAVRLSKAEIGVPDFPNLHFARAIRLSLIDPEGNILLIAALDRIPKNQAVVFLQPQGKHDLLPFFRQKSLDILLEVDNSLLADEGIMLIGSFEFELVY